MLISGSYTIDAAGHGALAITSSFGVQQLSFSVPKLEMSQITGMPLFSKDGYVVFGTGSLQLQTVLGPSLQGFGDYALDLSGYLPCNSTCNEGASISRAARLVSPPIRMAAMAPCRAPRAQCCCRMSLSKI